MTNGRIIAGKKIPTEKHRLSIFKKRILTNGKYYQRYLENSSVDFSDIIINPKKGVSLADIDTFENNNRDISVNVYNSVDKMLKVLRTTPDLRQNHVNLLLITENENSHYVYINDFSRLIGKDGKHRHIYCFKCHKKFINKIVRDSHSCGSNFQQKIKPPMTNTYRFSKLFLTLKSPFILYYKFHLVYINSEIAGSDIVGHYEPVGYSLCVVSQSDVKFFEIYEKENVVETFISRVLELGREYVHLIETTNNFVPPTLEELERHEAATNCFYCQEIFTIENRKTFHHDHWSGSFLHSVCNRDNLQIKYKKMLTCVGFGASKYELQILTRGLSSKLVFNMNPIMKSSGQMIGMEINKLIRFVDVINFRPEETLEYVISEMVKDNIKLNFSNNYFSPEIQNLLLSGNVKIPCCNSLAEYFSLLGSDREFSKQDFQNKMTGESITDLQYSDSVALLNLLQNSREKYNRVYMISKCLQLADFFEHFRDQLFKENGIDVSQCYSLSSFSFHSAFLWERLEVGLVKCPNIRSIVEAGIMGGVLNLTTSSCKSNSKRFSNFDKTQPNSEILFVDIASNYSSQMEGYLPWQAFEVMSNDEIEKFDFLNCPKDTGIGYIFVIDFSYPESIHDLLSDLPFPPERRQVSVSLLSEVQLAHASKYRGSYKLESEYLLSTLLSKTNATHYYKMISFMLSKGIVIDRVHTGIKFTEKPIFKSYIQYNLEKRNNAKTELDRRWYKLICNALSGRLLLNSSKYPRAKYCFSSTEAISLLSSHLFESFDRISEDLTLFKLKKLTVQDLSLRIIGMVILSNAKLNLYELIYNGLKPVFGNDMQGIFTHTDSFLAKIIDLDGNYLTKLKSLGHIFDFSNLDPSHQLYDTRFRGKPGVFKIVHDGILEFLAISCSMYSLEIESGNSNIYVNRHGGGPKSISERERYKEWPLTGIKN